MFNSNMPSLADIAAVTKDNDGFGGNNGWWILIILFAIFGGWGNGGFAGGNGANGAYGGYVLASDFANVQRQIDSATTTIENKLDNVNNGICSLGYDQLGQMNGINTNISNAQTALMAQLNAMAANEASCCCQTQNLITSSFADLNYNLATQECDTRRTIVDIGRNIIDNDNANYRALNDRITGLEMNAKDDKIAALQAQVQALNLAASQERQNNYLVNALKPAPIPAYTVANPNASLFGCGQFAGYSGCNC